MLRSDIPQAATGDKVGIGMRLNGQLIVRSLCPYVVRLCLCLASGGQRALLLMFGDVIRGGEQEPRALIVATPA